MYAGLQPVTLPTTEFVLLSDAKSHLRVDTSFTADDAYLTRLISMARSQCESIMRRAFLSQTWTLSLKNWPGRDYENWPVSLTSELDVYYKYNYIKLPLPPLQSVTSVTYYNSSGAQLTMPQLTLSNQNVLGGYNVFTQFEPGRIVLPFSGIWPTDILLPGAPIQITYVAGFANAAAFAAQAEYYNAVVQGILQLVGYTYENRIPPSEMRRSSVAAGLDLIVAENLEPYRIFD